MSNHKNNFFKKFFVALSVALFGLAIFGPLTALASPSDYSKNYEYPLIDSKDCLNGDFIEYSSVVNNADPKKVTGVPKSGLACIRLTTAADKGYNFVALNTKSNTTCDNVIKSPGNETGSLTTHLIHHPFGWFCVVVSKNSRWDTTEYDRVAGPPPTCATLKTGNDCIARSPDVAANGGCGLDSNSQPDTSQSITDQCGLTKKYIDPLIKILAGVVGLVVTIMVIVGGIEYSTAGGDPARVASAKKRIFNALFALLAFILLYAVLYWVIPGGIT